MFVSDWLLVIYSLFEMLVSDWLLVIYSLFAATAAHHNLKGKRTHHPDRQTSNRELQNLNIHRSLRREAKNKMNGLLLLTVNPNWVTIKPEIVNRKLMRTKLQTVRQRRSMRTVTHNAFIEVDIKTPFVPKKIVPKDLKSVIKYKNKTNKNQSVEKSRNVNNKDFETEADSVSMDTKVLSRIQQLENELNAMKVQVMNDSETIENLKSKVLEKDREIAELNFTNETLPINKNTDKYKREENMTLINISNLRTQVKSTQGTQGFKHVGSTKDEFTKTLKETTEEAKLYVPNRRSFTKQTVPLLQNKQQSFKYTSSKSQSLQDEWYKHSDKYKNVTHNMELRYDVNSNKFKQDEGKRDAGFIGSANNHESGKRETHAKQSIEEVTQDGNIEAKKFEKMAETKYPISITLNMDLGNKLRAENAQDKEDITKIQFSEGKEYVDSTKTIITEIPPKINPETDQVNAIDHRLIAKRRDFKIDYPEGADQMDIPEDQIVNEDGQLVPKIGNDELNNADTDQFTNKRNEFFNSNEYKRKLNEERIENAIDWKKFNPKAFLAQISAELKEKTRMDTNDKEMSTIVPFSGRRMLSDKTINLTEINNSPDNADKLDNVETTTYMFAPAPPGQRKVVLINDMAVVIPPAPVEVKDNDNSPTLFYPNLTTPENVDRTSRSPLAPEAGKQTLILDSTEDLVRTALRRFGAGKAHVPPSFDFDVYRQKLHRNDGDERQKLHQKVAERMKAKISKSGRRNMNPINIGLQYDISEDILNDPFLNDSFI